MVIIFIQSDNVLNFALQKKFAKGIRLYGKNFFRIRKELLPNRETVSTCLEICIYCGCFLPVWTFTSACCCVVVVVSAEQGVALNCGIISTECEWFVSFTPILPQQMWSSVCVCVCV